MSKSKTGLTMAEIHARHQARVDALSAKQHGHKKDASGLSTSGGPYTRSHDKLLHMINYGSDSSQLTDLSNQEDAAHESGDTTSENKLDSRRMSIAKKKYKDGRRVVKDSPKAWTKVSTSPQDAY